MADTIANGTSIRFLTRKETTEERGISARPVNFDSPDQPGCGFGAKLSMILIEGEAWEFTRNFDDILHVSIEFALTARIGLAYNRFVYSECLNKFLNGQQLIQAAVRKPFEGDDVIPHHQVAVVDLIPGFVVRNQQRCQIDILACQDISPELRGDWVKIWEGIRRYPPRFHD
jgi:hypothetical protein